MTSLKLKRPCIKDRSFSPCSACDFQSPSTSFLRIFNLLSWVHLQSYLRFFFFSFLFSNSQKASEKVTPQYKVTDNSFTYDELISIFKICFLSVSQSIRKSLTLGPHHTQYVSPKNTAIFFCMVKYQYLTPDTNINEILSITFPFFLSFFFLQSWALNPEHTC